MFIMTGLGGFGVLAVLFAAEEAGAAPVLDVALGGLHGDAEAGGQLVEGLGAEGSGKGVVELLLSGGAFSGRLGEVGAGELAEDAAGVLDEDAGDGHGGMEVFVVAIEVSEGVEVFPEPEEMPTFSQELFGHLPSILDAVARNATSNEDADLLLLGSIVSLSACLPGVSGVYADRTVYPNLFLYVTAPASAGKGRLALCRRLVQPIHNQLREFYHTEMDEYRINKARYEAEKKKHPDAEPPEEPRQQMLIIPANSSSTAVYQILNDNGGNGLLFETEGDTLANVFSSDFGNYSDGLRKCFHHETISYTRRKDKEFVELGGPRLSTVLSGTPRQISALIPDAENGLFSRFIFYYLNFKLEWIDVFARKSDFTLEEIFDDIGYGYLEFYQNLQMLGQMEFSLTPSQQQDFNTYYRSAQEEYHYLFGDDIIASVRRLGLITFRIAMVISTLRTMDTGEMSHHLICDDEDFHSAMTIARVLIKHTGRVFRELSSADLAKPAAERSARQKQFYDALPGTFSTQAFNQLATRLGIPMKTAQRYIKNWCSSGLLRREKHGQYAKPS